MNHPSGCLCFGCFEARTVSDAIDVLAAHGRAPDASDRWLAACARHMLADRAKLCDSPAEEAMLAGLFIEDAGRAVSCVQQHGVGPYRIDFAFVAERLAIEVDGHQFHDRTPEQAERDRTRDRYLLSLDWRIARFTAREVFREATSCARQVFALLGGSAT